jgi:hypothetical protein
MVRDQKLKLEVKVSHRWIQGMERREGLEWERKSDCVLKLVVVQPGGGESLAH